MTTPESVQLMVSNMGVLGAAGLAAGSWQAKACPTKTGQHWWRRRFRLRKGHGQSHVSSNKERAWRGRAKFKSTVPPRAEGHLGDSRSSRRPADSSLAYCSGVGFCGEPISFHTVYALL